MIDIVIPVYKAPEDLRKCIDSVIAHTAVEQYSLTLIDDGSDDAAVRALFAKLRSERPSVRLLENEGNRGFTFTVNRAFKETTGDVLLLNSDTVVTPGWLPAMVRALQSDPRIATVTPFSNNAEIASIPKWLEANLVPTPQVAALTARACADTDAGLYPDLPTGVGFCMLMRRTAIAQIGEFDEATFGRGYGEENDWCQRAKKAGWRNVLCPGAYVVHTGSQSFSDSKKALVEKNTVKLNQKHPGYDLEVQTFIARDTIAPFRQAVASRLQALQREHEPGVLHILHGKDGGLERHARDLIALHHACRHYVLLALGETWHIEDHTGHAPAYFEIAHQPDELWRDFFDGICARFNVSIVHVHHISANRDGLLLALEATPLPIVITLHDFYYQCPAVHLLRGDDSYCGGETDTSTCQRCIDSHPSVGPVNVEHWRQQNAALLARAKAVISPSAFTTQVTQRVFSNVAITTLPHPSRVTFAADPAPQVSPTQVTITVVGAIGPLKGARVVEAMAQRLRERKLAARVVVIGYLDKQFTAATLMGGRLVVHGAYAPNELPKLLRQYETSVVLFPAIGPETFGFVLSEVWQCGFAPLVSNVGAVAERVRASGAGWLMESSTASAESADAWIDAALGIAQVNGEEQARRAGLGRLHVRAEEVAYADGLSYQRLRVGADGGHYAPRAQLAAARWHAASAPHTARTHIRSSRAGRIMRTLRFSQIFAILLRYRYTSLGKLTEKALSPDAKRRIRAYIQGR
jgi:GT2 family glycosyltransferase